MKMYDVCIFNNTDKPYKLHRLQHETDGGLKKERMMNTVNAIATTHYGSCNVMRKWIPISPICQPYNGN